MAEAKKSKTDVTARDKSGRDCVVEEKSVAVRTQDASGAWSDWQPQANEFWYGSVICARLGDNEFVPVLTDELLTVSKP